MTKGEWGNHIRLSCYSAIVGGGGTLFGPCARRDRDIDRARSVNVCGVLGRDMTTSARSDAAAVPPTMREPSVLGPVRVCHGFDVGRTFLRILDRPRWTTRPAGAGNQHGNLGDLAVLGAADALCAGLRAVDDADGDVVLARWKWGRRGAACPRRRVLVAQDHGIDFGFSMSVALPARHVEARVCAAATAATGVRNCAIFRA